MRKQPILLASAFLAALLSSCGGGSSSASSSSGALTSESSSTSSASTTSNPNPGDGSKNGSKGETTTTKADPGPGSKGTSDQQWTTEWPETSTPDDFEPYSPNISSLPRIDIATEGGMAIDDESLKQSQTSQGVVKYNYIGATIKVTDGEETPINDVSGKVKVRGNFTSTYPKRPIRIKFDKKQSMLGLNGGKKFKNWVLLAEYKDTSLLKNTLTDFLGKNILGNDDEYCTDFRAVEVYLNGQYNGLYTLAEQQEVKEGRVDVPEIRDPADYPDLDESELSDPHVGYFVEYDGYYTDEDAAQTFTLDYPKGRKDRNGKAINYAQPGYTIKNDVYFSTQRDYIKKVTQSVVNLMDDAIYGDHTSTPYYAMDTEGNLTRDSSIKDSKEAIGNVMDLDSLVDMFIIQEIAMDMDIDWSSFFLCFDASPEGDHKFHYTAPWDFDSAYGDANADTSGLFSLSSTGDGGQGGKAGGVVHNHCNPWLMPFSTVSWFLPMVKEKWDLHMQAGTFKRASEMIDAYGEAYHDAYVNNHSKWGNGQGGSKGGEPGGQPAGNSEETFNAQEDLKVFFEKRVFALDNILKGA